MEENEITKKEITLTGKFCVVRALKKLLALVALIVLFTACEKETVFQKGIVIKTEANDTYGYKYRVEVINFTHKGVKPSWYKLLTNENYRVGDTITIK